MSAEKLITIKKNYQITNPTYIKELDSKKEITKVFPKYSLTEGLNEKIYRNIIYRVLQDFDASDEWYSDNFLKENNFSKLQKVLLNLHNPSTKKDLIQMIIEDLYMMKYFQILFIFLHQEK